MNSSPADLSLHLAITSEWEPPTINVPVAPAEDRPLLLLFSSHHTALNHKVCHTSSESLMLGVIGFNIDVENFLVAVPSCASH